MRARRTAVVLTVVAWLSLAAAARADAAPLCRITAAGSHEYQRILGPLVSDVVPALPAPGQPAPPAPARTTGAFTLARATLGPQFGGGWLSGAVEGWVVGLAPGQLDGEAARAAIVERLVGVFTAAEAAYLAERLHVDPQPYSEDDLRATAAAISSALVAERLTAGVGYGSCRLSDARRVEVELYVDATPAMIARARELIAPHGDKARLVVLPHGPPSPAIGRGPSDPTIRPSRPRPPSLSIGRYVTMPLARRCVRGAQIRVAVRAGRSSVRALTVRSGGRTRAISGARLRKPLTVALRPRRTTVVVTVRLADGRSARRTATYTRCA